MYGMHAAVEVVRGVAVVGLLITLPVLVALTVYLVIEDVDLRQALARTPSAILGGLAVSLNAAALQFDHLPANGESTTVTDEQVHNWFVVAERQALRRLERDRKGRRYHGQHHAGTGIPASSLIAQCITERLHREAATA